MITLRIFLSSTFNDMAEERNELVRRRFPVLRAWAEGLGVHLAEVDLRWGVTNPSSLDACLAEVDECRPLFVCFLGHHFGSRVSGASLSDEVRAKYPWISSDQHLGCSYTELEIIHAVLRHDGPPMQSLFYFRSASFSAEVERKLGIKNSDASLQEALKQRIRQAGLPLREGYTRAEELAGWIEEDLRRIIQARAAEHRPGAGWMLRRGRRWAGNLAAMEELSAVALRHWQPGWLSKILRHLPPGGFVISGPAGCGKSTFLAAWARMVGHGGVQLITAEDRTPVMPALETLRSLHPAVLCLSVEDHPAGASAKPGGTEAWPLFVWRVMDFIRRRWALDLNVPAHTSPLALLYALPAALEKIPATERLILVVDGLDLLSDRSRSNVLAWLPEHLPPQIFVVVSLAGDASELISRRGWAHRVLEERPSPLLLQKLVKADLRDHGKNLSDEQACAAEALLSQVNARWMGLMLADLRRIGFRTQLSPRLALLSQAAGDPAALGRLLLENLARQQGAKWVWRALALLMEARTGLFEMEWRALLRPPTLEVLPSQVWSPIFHVLRDWLLPSSGVLAPTPELRQAWNSWLSARPAAVADKRLANARNRLEEYFTGQGAVSERALEHLPWLARHSPRVLQQLLTPPWLGMLWRDRPDEVSLLCRPLDDAAFSRVLALWEAQFINQDADGWHALGEEAARRHLLTEALSAARRAQELACPAAGLTEAVVMRQAGNHDAALTRLQAMHSRLDVPEPAASQASLLLADWLFEREDFSGAAVCARTALARASQRGEPGLWMQACDLLGRLTLRSEAPASALPFYRELERLAGLTGARRELILGKQGQGEALRWLQGRRPEAIRLLKSAADVAARSQDLAMHQSVLGSLIRVLRDEPGGIVEAMGFMVQRLALVQQIGDAAAEAGALFQYGQLCQDTDQAQRAYAFFHQALTTARRTGQPALVRECEAALESLTR